ncbi:hypothetical protein TeGR_g3261 [Tetraparma gracilis]|uniref:Uncharacterized protein n=1 Tax=Tetraparma gracilis TaxID=2962635 RepID=A0ABQ6MIE6_9STRA|nr:hypothetical protein TeGR_g3261 [Tetraparma gracilis]
MAPSNSTSARELQKEQGGCVELTLSGACSETMFGEGSTTFVLYEGGCEGAAGGTAWHAPAEDVFMSYFIGGGNSFWIVSSGCGSTVGLIGYGSASPSLPFLDTDSSWTCATSAGIASTRALSITCSSYDGDELEVLPCVSGTFDESGEAPGGECDESCPEDRPTSPPGSTTAATCLPPPETCLEVSLVGSCSGTWSEADLWGTFVPFEGDCGDLSVNGGRQSYFNELTQFYLYFFASYNEWFVSKLCGSHVGVSASGSAGTYPFLSPAATWDCSDGGFFVSKPASIVCSRYASEPEVCIEGTYEESPADLGLEVSATGLIPGTNFSTTIAGKIGVDRSAPPHSALTASLSIPYAGEWSFRVTQNEVYLDDPSDATTLPGLTFSDAMTSAGSKKLNIIHDVDGVETEIAGSPFGFQVLAAAADAASSTHNVDFASFESRKAAATLLELRVDPFDSFNNTLPTATGYAVAMNGGDLIPLLPPSFSYTHTIPQGFSGSLLLSFTLDGTPIANSPVTVDVAPDWTVVIVGSAGAVVILLVVFIFTRKSSKRFVSPEEQVVSLDEKTRKEFSYRISVQRVWMVYEIVDAMGDISKPIYSAAVGDTSLWLLVVLYALKLFGPNSKGGEIGHDNALVQLDLVNLDIALEEMALRGVMIESIPSILVFFIELGSARNRPLKTLILSIVNALVSVILIGRKSYLPNRKKDMKAQKGDLEEKLRAMKEPGRKSSVKGSQKLLASVFGGAAAAETEALMDAAVERGGAKEEELRDVEAAPLESRLALAQSEVQRLNSELGALREENVGLRKRVGGGGMNGALTLTLAGLALTLPDDYSITDSSHLHGSIAFLRVWNDMELQQDDVEQLYEEHIGGSPYTYFVSEGPTDPDSCLLDFHPSVKAGEEFRVAIETYDFHGNPTEHFDDVFLCLIDDGVPVEINRADDGTVVFSELVTAAGPNRLTIVHNTTNTEVASSPISFDVSPAAADATSSTHNLGDTKRIVSNPGATITVQVFPRDAYGNKVVTAAGFKVKMTVLGQDFGVVNLAIYRGGKVAMKQEAFPTAMEDIRMQAQVSGRDESLLNQQQKGMAWLARDSSNPRIALCCVAAYPRHQQPSERAHIALCAQRGLALIAKEVGRGGKARVVTHALGSFVGHTRPEVFAEALFDAVDACR